MPPLFSIGVTTFDRHKMLRECLASICAQVFADYEVVIGNDCVGDELSLSEFGIDDPRFRLVNHEKNLGEVSNMNWLLDQAKGEYFLWLADDDLIHPEFLNCLSHVIAQKGDNAPVAVYTGYDSGPEPPVFQDVICDLDSGYNYGLVDFLEVFLSRKVDLIGCYGAMRTVYLREIGGMKKLGSGFGPYSDTVLPILLAEKGTITFLPQKLVYLRTHSDSLSCKSGDLHAYLTAEDDFFGLLTMLCVRNNIIAGQGYLLCLLLRWFAGNSCAVIVRSSDRFDFSLWLSVLNRQLARSRQSGMLGCSLLQVLYWVKMLLGGAVRYFKARIVGRLDVK